MQNIESILKEFGVELPADKLTELNKKVAENYVTKAEHSKKVERAESDRDEWKQKAETAEETLKGFEGIDPAQIQTELETWKRKAEDAEKDYAGKIYERDFSDALKTALDEIEFSSTAAKKAIMAEIKEAGLKLKDGKILGLNDLLDQMRENDSSAFVDESQQRARQNAAKFTAPAGKKTPPGGMTKDEIMSIKDSGERQAKIAENMHLFS